jgi:hypothetical protein
MTTEPTKAAVCEWCATDDIDDDSVQLRECGHVLCENCAVPCLICEGASDE